VKLQLASAGGANVVTRYGDGYVVVNQQRFERSLVLMPEHLLTEWEGVTYETLAVQHMEALAALDQEIILLGTGNRLRFPSRDILRPMAGKGLEIMDVQAACRTYNILMAEGRKVAAVLLLG
jgi:uncharacterized protein